MKTDFFQEPLLEFGVDKHVDIKFGLMNYGPLDFQMSTAPKNIKLGIIGTHESIEGVQEWIEKCRIGIPAKISRRPNLFPRFPGFSTNSRLCADFIFDNQLFRIIPEKNFQIYCDLPKTEKTSIAIANLFLEEMEYLTQKTTVDVLVCAYPFCLVKYLAQEEDVSLLDDESERGQILQPIASSFVFHDYLKAKAMMYKKPTQIIRPSTYDDSKRLKRNHPSGEYRQIQDEATRAWNLYIALYYKSGGTPWRLIREWSQLSTCYIGVSFYKSTDEKVLLTSTAQVFNERGEGVILRGGSGQISKDDRQIHLSSENAYALLKNALSNYHREHKNYPARVVVHKSSIHNRDEIIGFDQALKECSIDRDAADFVSITRSFTRLFRQNIYPPLRGTYFDPGGSIYILYTKGSVDFYNTYPGLYIPLPLGFRCDRTSQTPKYIAKEILGLTKMNWNNAQFDGGEPITLRAARQVGSILKYLDDIYEPYYRYYM